MLCSEIMQILERQSPAEYAMDWDHVGLLTGRRDREVKKLLLCLDVTLQVIRQAVREQVDLIVSHHPVIFTKMDRVNDETVLGRKLLMLLEHGICCFAMHTNFDTRGGMGRLAGARLGLKNVEVLEETKDGEGIGVLGILDTPLTAEALSEKVKKDFDLKNVLLFDPASFLRNDTGNAASGHTPGSGMDKIAICPGSGKSVIKSALAAGAECLITGDLGHHDGIDAMEAGLTLIDASHFGLEKLFVEFMYEYLRDFLPGVELIRARQECPYRVV